MGAGASVEIRDEELKDLMSTAEDLSTSCGEKHRRFLLKQKGLVHKNHAAIIEIVCGHTKNDLFNHVICQGLNKDELNDIAGGQAYGGFLSRLPQPDQQLKLRDIQLACSGIGLNAESMALTLLCTKPGEIPALIASASAKFGINFPDLVKKSVSNPVHKIFFDILIADPQAGLDMDKFDGSTAKLTAESCPEGTFVELLMNMSYDQLDTLRKKIHATHGTLETIVDKRLGSNPLRNYIRVAIQPSLSAKVAEAICQQRKNTQQCVKLLSRYDTAFLREVDTSVQTATGQTIVDLLKDAAFKGQGNLGAAVKEWMSSTALEKICEENIQFYVDDSIRNGVSMANLFASEDHCSAIKDLFQELISALEGALGTDAGGESDNSENEESEAPLLKKETKPKTARYEMNEKSDADGDSFNEKLTLVTNYLLEIYVALDSKNLGTLPNDIFWSVFADLDIAKLVYTEEEIATMPDLLENISTDGNVYWADILAEMSEGILSGMVRNEISCRQFLDEQMATSGAKLKAALEEGQSILEDISGEIYNNDEDLYVAQSLSPDLLTYLEKTFHAFDKENKGFLSRDDFWFMLQLLNLGVAGTGSELDAVMESFDANADGHIEWKEALPKFDDIIHDMCSDEQDHWIGLEDPDSTPPCFWYNLLDGASQWMSEEEAENYKSHKDTGVQLAGPDTKSMTCSNIGIVTHIMHLKKMLASKKSLRESVENDDNMDPDQKSAALQKIDIDYTETIKTLRMQLETALKQLDQRLGQDRGDKKKKLQIRLEEKKKKKNKATM